MTFLKKPENGRIYFEKKKNLKKEFKSYFYTIDFSSKRISFFKNKERTEKPLTHKSVEIRGGMFFNSEQIRKAPNVVKLLIPTRGKKNSPKSFYFKAYNRNELNTFMKQLESCDCHFRGIEFPKNEMEGILFNMCNEVSRLNEDVKKLMDEKEVLMKILKKHNLVKEVDKYYKAVALKKKKEAEKRRKEVEKRRRAEEARRKKEEEERKKREEELKRQELKRLKEIQEKKKRKKNLEILKRKKPKSFSAQRRPRALPMTAEEKRKKEEERKKKEREKRLREEKKKREEAEKFFYKPQDEHTEVVSQMSLVQNIFGRSMNLGVDDSELDKKISEEEEARRKLTEEEENNLDMLMQRIDLMEDF